MGQLAERLEGEFSEADGLAVLSAVMMGVAEGTRRGMTAAHYAANVQAKRQGVQLQPGPALGHVPDLWAERYGDHGA
jgi:hypothetical protein